MLAGFDVKRVKFTACPSAGGSVVSHVRFVPRSLLADRSEGEGDILFGFELLETYGPCRCCARAARWSPMITASPPPRCSSPGQLRRNDLARRMRDRFPDFLLVDGLPSGATGW